MRTPAIVFFIVLIFQIIYGAFTAGRATRPHVVMVGGGVGITPIRALMDEFKNGVKMDVIYRVSKKEDLELNQN